MNILIVEPDVMLARTYSQALESAGHEVRSAKTAQSAIFAVDESVPDSIVLELQLVSHSGIEFLYELRSYGEWQQIPVVVLSLVPPAEFIDSWPLLQDELGVVAYHYKPRTSLVKLRRVVDEIDYRLSMFDFRSSSSSAAPKIQNGTLVPGHDRVSKIGSTED